MAKSVAKKASNLFVWIILGLLFVALAGFGIGSFTGGGSRIGSVGEVEITVSDYQRALDEELRAQMAERQQVVTFSQMQAEGLDQMVLQALVARAALSNEAETIGLSVGDEEVARQITEIEAFQGLDGSFDREAYEFTLRQNGLTPSQFEEETRRRTARTLLQVAVLGGLQPDPTIAEALVAYQGETRDFSLLTLTEADLPEGAVPAPTEADLQAYYDANPDRFTRPEARRITYAWITPSMIMDDMEIDEGALRDLYDQRADLYRQPERRLLEQLVFLDDAAAQAALDAIAAGDTDFDTLVAERGLSLEDIDLGEVAEDDLLPEAAAVIFADTETEILGPLPSALGPALYRVNAVLDASEVPFEEAAEELRAELASEAARRAIDDLRDPVDDLLAEGATLEELAADTELQLGTIDVTPVSEDGIAAYEAFREAARLAEEGDFPELLELSDGGLFALRLDEVVPPTLPPLDDVREEVAAAWEASALREALAARGQEVVTALATEATLESFGTLTREQQVRRQDFIPDAPPTLVAQVYQLAAPGDVVLVPGAEVAVIARLDAINPAARDDPTTQILTQIIGQTVAQSMAQDIFEAYGQAMQADVGIRLDQSMINAVHAQFP